jgi:three-Cys-motif partner protein
MTKSWGGTWTEQKLDVFEKYVKAYLAIMNKHRGDKRLIYFDAFAGSGSRSASSPTQQTASLFAELDLTEEETQVYHGAAERIVCIDQPGFDLYYFIETDDTAREALENKLISIDNNNKLKLQFRPGDANKWLDIMANTMKTDSRYYALTLLDPFGMQVDWNSIAKLANTHTDLWILIPSGVIINRLLDNSHKLSHIDKLVSHLGLPEDEIKNTFYKQEKTAPDLFGNDTVVHKIEQPIKSIADLYIRQLNTIFPYVTKEPLEMRNSKNCPIYHFAFASNNKTAVKIATDIIGRESI